MHCAMHKCNLVKTEGKEKHIKYVKTRKFAENRGKFVKIGGKNNFVEIGENVFK